MVNFKRLADQAKSVVDKRGGVDALKKDAEQLKGIATGKGTLTDKAKAAADALKHPSDSTAAPTQSQPTPAAGPQDPEAIGSTSPADKPRGENRGDRGQEKHRGRRRGAHRGQDGRGGGDTKPDA